MREYYRDSLAFSGHRRVESYSVLRGAWRLPSPNVLRRLRDRAGLAHVVRFTMSDAVDARAKEVKSLIEETECAFDAHWTSFMCEDERGLLELLFLFRTQADAVKFRLLWD